MGADWSWSSVCFRGDVWASLRVVCRTAWVILLISCRIAICGACCVRGLRQLGRDVCWSGVLSWSGC